jgi:hypothetical protein
LEGCRVHALEPMVVSWVSYCPLLSIAGTKPLQPAGFRHCSIVSLTIGFSEK